MVQNFQIYYIHYFVLSLSLDDDLVVLLQLFKYFVGFHQFLLHLPKVMPVMYARVALGLLGLLRSGSCWPVLLYNSIPILLDHIDTVAV